MANPQLEDGYTMIANEILDSLMCIELSANQWQVLVCIIRKTYGYKKKVDRIANFQICDATGLRKDVVSRALRRLEKIGVILRYDKLIGFQKDYQKWKLAELPTKLAKLPTKVGSSHVTQKKKGNIQNKIRYRNIQNKTNKAYDIWRNVLDSIRTQIKLANYNTWYADTIGLGYTNNTFIVGVPNAEIAQYLTGNNHALIESIISGNEKLPTKVDFVLLDEYLSEHKRQKPYREGIKGKKRGTKALTRG